MVLKNLWDILFYTVNHLYISLKSCYDNSTKCWGQTQLSP